MRYDNIKIKGRGISQIHRYKKTFEKILEILKEAEFTRCRKGGHKSKLWIEDMLLSTEYLRESRTYFHNAQNYGVHETTAVRICRWVENVLIQSGKFSLPGKKVLAKSDVEFDLVLIDATETAIERPKKQET